ncbi:MAG: tripartite tricarboxylate transporter substrate binding protein, partial [Burkholderiales bacterium]|nr:tripartite tricarboxylate transporter substrate binding protein [Burkholderiales bacterium]
MTQREAIARPVPGIAAVLAAAATLAGMVALHAAPASAQTEGSYPHRAIRIVVPFGAGTQSDSATRLV